LQEVRRPAEDGPSLADVHGRLLQGVQEDSLVTKQIEAIVIRADVPGPGGTIVTADVVRGMADGVRLFWDEDSKALIYRGPEDGLPYEPAVRS
jgi:hypothetical protein